MRVPTDLEQVCFLCAPGLITLNPFGDSGLARGLLSLFAMATKGTSRLRGSIQRALEDGVVERSEAKKIAKAAKKGGLSGAKRALVRELLNRNERDVFQSYRAREPLLSIGGTSKRPLYGAPEAEQAFGRALADGQLSRKETRSLVKELNRSSVTVSAREFIQGLGPQAQAVLAKVRGARSAEPVAPPAESLFDTEEVNFLTGLNAYRALRGLAPVRPSAVLTRAAEAHSAWMKETGNLDHTGANGSTPAERVRQQSPESQEKRAVGEILARGPSGGADVLGAWQASTEHDPVMLRDHYVEVGIARVQDDQGRMVWTAVFGGKPLP